MECTKVLKNNYHQTFVDFGVMTYIHVKLALFIYHLFRLYKNQVKKEKNIKQKWFLKRQKKEQKNIQMRQK